MTLNPWHELAALARRYKEISHSNKAGDRSARCEALFSARLEVRQSPGQVAVPLFGDELPETELRRIPDGTVRTPGRSDTKAGPPRRTGRPCCPCRCRTRT